MRDEHSDSTGGQRRAAVGLLIKNNAPQQASRPPRHRLFGGATPAGVAGGGKLKVPGDAGGLLYTGKGEYATAE